MRKATILLVVLLLSLLILVAAGFCVVKAQDSLFEAELSVKTPTPIYVNETVQIIAHVVGGEPPYTYQWETQPLTQPQFIPPYILPIGLNWTELPSNNYATLNFVTSIPGTYIVQFDVNDTSKLIGADTTFDVLPLPSVSPSPTPTPSPPNILVLSLENKTYTTNNLSLNFTISKPAQWVGYSLDGQANITIDGNTTLTELSNGQHTVAIYANDTNGNFAQTQTITFTVEKSEPFPTITVVIVLGAVVVSVVCIVSLLFYRRYRKIT
jgi:hypothetical protein